MKLTKIALVAALLASEATAEASDFTYTDPQGNVWHFDILSKGKESGSALDRCGTAKVTYAGSIETPEEWVKSEETLTVPSFVQHFDKTYQVTEIGPMAFAGQKNLTAVTIPLAVDKVSPFAFYDCTALNTIEYPNEIVEVDDNAFFGCINLKKIQFGKDWENVDFKPYRWSESLQEVSVPFSVSKISNLEHLPYLNYIKLDDPISSTDRSNYLVREGCLYGMGGSELLFVPAGVEGEFTISADAKKISDNAFSHCSKISDIIIPRPVNMSHTVFADMQSLKSITIECSNLLSNGKMLNGDQVLALQVWNPNVTLYVNADKIDKYRNILLNDGEFLPSGETDKRTFSGNAVKTIKAIKK